MSIQIGNRTVESLISNRERLVIQSSQSNLIHMHSDSPNSYVLFESTAGALYSWGMCNTAFVIRAGDTTIASFTPEATTYFTPTIYNSTISMPSPISSNILTSNIKISDARSLTDTYPLIQTLNSNVRSFAVLPSGAALFSGPVGIGASLLSPLDALHVDSNIRTNRTAISSNILTNYISSSNAAVPLVVRGDISITGALILQNKLVIPSLAVTQDSILSQTTLNATASNSTPPTNSSNTIPTLQINQLTSTSNVIQTTYNYSYSSNSSTCNASAPGFTLDRHGRIGIGLATPTSYLHILATSLASVHLGISNIPPITSSLATLQSINNTFSINSNAYLNIGQQTPYLIANSTIFSASPSSASSASAIPYPNMFYIQSSNILSIDKWANIGIGTTAPLHALHIAATSNTGTNPLIGLHCTASASNSFMRFTSNATQLFAVGTDGHLKVGIAPAPVLYKTNYSIQTDTVASFPATETASIWAPFVTTLATSNTTATTPQASNIVSAITIQTANPQETSNTVFTSNIFFNIINTSNIINYADKTTSLIWSSQISLTSNVTSNDFPADPGTCNILNIFTSNISSNITFTLTSNLNYFQSNIGFNGTSLNNIGTLSTSNLVSSFGVINNLRASVFTTTNLITNDIVINGFTVQSSNVTVSLSNFIFTGSAFCLDRAGVAQTNPLVDGKLKLVLDDAAADNNATVPAISIQANSNVSLAMASRARGSVIEFGAATGLPSSVTGHIGINTSGTGGSGLIYLGFKTDITQKLTITTAGVNIGGFIKTLVNGNIGLGLGTTDAPLYQLHIRTVGTSAPAPLAVFNSDNSIILLVDGVAGRRHVGIGTSSPSANLHVQGSCLVTGSVNFSSNLNVVGQIVGTRSIMTTSDKTVKTNLVPISGAMNKIMELTGYTYDRTDIVGPRETGILAQDLLRVLPEAVLSTPSAGLSVAYGNMAGLFVEAFKEMQAEIQALKRQLRPPRPPSPSPYSLNSLKE